MDAGGDGGEAAPDAFTASLSVDFATAGCPMPVDPDAGLPPGCCRGPAPLTLSFVPLTAGPVTRHLWQFGDETASNLPAPTHTYAIPNRYPVTLVAGGEAGTLSRTKEACVVVAPNPVGATCDVDVQCEAQTSCVCGAAAECPPPFVRGICSLGCRDAPCAAPAVCADLSLGGAASTEAPWRRPMCLAPCQVDADCAAGLLCRSLPSRFPAGDWVRACFAPFPLPIGSPCRNARGQLEPSSCTSGRCANLGALGQCSADCTTGSCPIGTACASFANGNKLCVATCGSRFRCTDDPLLTCRLPGGNGPWSFSIMGSTPAAETSFCTPKPCQNDAECPGARCAMSGGAGQCQSQAP